MNKTIIRKERVLHIIQLFNRLSPGDDFNRAILLATLVHTEDEDKANKPYIEHVMRVITGCQTSGGKVVAALHDVCEDHPEYTLQDLLDMGFSPYQVQGVDNITKRQGEAKQDYYNRVMSQDNSWDAKLSDLRENSNLDRLEVITEKDIVRTEQYKATIVLMSANFNPA